MPLGRGLGSLIPDKKTMAPLIMGLTTRAAVADDSVVRNIPIDVIDPNPYQPRREFDEKAMESLATSIKEHGLIQPIVVSQSDGGRYYLVVGERRLRAAKMAGLREILAYVRSTKDQDKLELALIENIQREDLNPLEEAMGYQRLKDEFGLTATEIARRAGKSRPVIFSRLLLLSLPDTAKEALVNGTLSYTVARALTQLANQPDDLMRVWHEAEEKKWDQQEVERVVVRLRDWGGKVGPKLRGRNPMDPIFLEKQRELEEMFGTKVRVTHTKKSSTITFTIFSDEEFFKTIERLLSLRD